MSTQVGCRRETAPAASATPAAPAAEAAKPLVVGAKMAPAEPHPKSFDGGPVQFIRDTMDEIYPKICVFHSMPQGQRANLWTNRYYGRWIHWTGRVRSYTQNGLAIVQRPEALTFDVSLRMDADQIAKLQQRVKVGELVTYEGQLDTYDDVFQKIYLLHGTVLAVNPPDGGI